MNLQPVGVVQAECSEGKQHTIEIFELVYRGAAGEMKSAIIGRRSGSDGATDIVYCFSKEPMVFADPTGFPKYYCDRPN